MDFLTQQFPFACKTAGQNFACFTARPIARESLSRALSRSQGQIPDARAATPPFFPVSLTGEGATYHTEIDKSNSKEKNAKLWGKGVTAISATNYIEREARRTSSLRDADPARKLELKNSSVAFIMRNMGTREPVLAASNAAISKGEAEAEATMWKGKMQPKLAYNIQNTFEDLGEDFEVLDVEDDCSDGMSQDDDDSSSVESGANGASTVSPRKPPALAFHSKIDGTQRRRLAQPVFLLELSSFRETHATLGSRADCVAFTQSLVEKTAGHSTWYTCVAPLYEWIALDEATLRKLDISIAQLGGVGVTTTVAAISLESGPGSPLTIRFGPTSEAGLGDKSAKRSSDKYHDAAHQGSTAVKNGGQGGQGPSEGSSLGFGFALGGTQEAKDNRALLLKNLIEARKSVLLSHDRLCLNEDINRKREEKSSRFHLLPSIMYSTNASCSQFDISLALKRRNVAKQHIKLLDTLVTSVPLRTVPAAPSEGANRNK